MTNITVEKIDNIIKKINKNSSKDLNEKEVRNLLDEIDDELTDIEENAEKKQKKIMGEKIGELRGIIDKSRKWKWGRISGALEADVKDELAELKNEIAKSEEVQVVPAVVVERDREKEEALEKELVEVKGELIRTKEELTKTKEELEKFRSAPSKSTGISGEVLDVYNDKISKLNEQIQEKEKQIEELKQQLGAKNEEVLVLTNKKSEKVNLIDDYEKAYDIWERAAKTGASEADRLPIIGPAVMASITGICGGVAGSAYMGVRTVESFTDKGVDFYKVTLESGTELAMHAGTGAVNVINQGMKSGEEISKELIEFSNNVANIWEKGFENVLKETRALTSDAMNVTAETIEGWRKGWENVTSQFMGNTTSVVNESIGVVKGAVDKGVGLEYKGFVIGAGMGRGNVLEAKVEGKVELIESLKEEVERLKKEIEEIKEGHKVELKDERERFVQELKEKNAEIERLQKQMEKQSDKTQDNFLSVIEMVTKSSSKPSSRASTPPPAYNKQ